MAQAATLTTQQVMALAGVSHLTIYNWRHGTATKDPLPCAEGDTPRNVVFRPRELKTWAKKNGVELKADPMALAQGLIKVKPYVVKSRKAKSAKKAVKLAKKAGSPNPRKRNS